MLPAGRYNRIGADFSLLCDDEEHQEGMGISAQGIFRFDEEDTRKRSASTYRTCRVSLPGVFLPGVFLFAFSFPMEKILRRLMPPVDEDSEEAQKWYYE